MKISIKLIYGIKFLLFLAKSDKTELIKINEIAKKENISEKFLENIVSRIKASGIIQVKRGAHGGYKLVKAPEQITLEEIFTILQGPVLINEEPGETVISTVVDDFVKGLKENMTNYLKSISLADLLVEYQTKNETKNNMFYI